MNIHVWNDERECLKQWIYNGLETDISCIRKLDYKKNRLMTTDGRPTFYSHFLSLLIKVYSYE